MDNFDLRKNFTSIDAKKAGKYIVFDGCPFSVNTKTTNTWYMVCASRCGTKMSVSPNYAQFKSIPAPIHSHPPKNPEKGRNFFDKLEKVQKDPTKTGKTVYEDECAKTCRQ